MRYAPAIRRTGPLAAGLILVAGITLAVAAESHAQEGTNKVRWAIAIHGGAGSSPENFSDEANASRHQAMQSALETGVAILEGSGTSLDAVEAVVRQLEDDPQFNAGKGAVFNAEAASRSGTDDCGIVPGQLC